MCAEDCSDQLIGVFTNMFLFHSTFPTCQSSIIVHLPFKTTSAASMTTDWWHLVRLLSPNHYEVLWEGGPESHHPVFQDEFQQHLIDNSFGFRRNRSTEDAVATALQAALSHLKQPVTYITLLLSLSTGSPQAACWAHCLSPCTLTTTVPLT